MGFAPPTVPQEICVLHFLFFLIAYYVAKNLSNILDKRRPWEDVKHIRTEREDEKIEEILTQNLRTHLRSYWYQAKNVKFFMVFCVLQAVLVAHSLTEKCRWNQVSLALAEHYKTVDQDLKPNIVPYLDFVSFMGVIGYIVLVNGAAVYVIYKQNKEYNQGQRVSARTRFSVIPFTILWFVLTNRIIVYCTFSDEEFNKLFEANEVGLESGGVTPL